MSTEEKKWNLPDKKHRRKIRYRLFRIREGNDAVDDDLKEFIESQFKGPMSWNYFTFNWDVGVKDPLTVITETEWDSVGGGYDMLTGGMYPPAFTNQDV